MIKGTKLKPNIHQKELKHEIAYLKIRKVIRIVESGKRGLKYNKTIKQIRRWEKHLL